MSLYIYIIHIILKMFSKYLYWDSRTHDIAYKILKYFNTYT